jgi:hypothetical protein
MGRWGLLQVAKFADFDPGVQVLLLLHQYRGPSQHSHAEDKSVSKAKSRVKTDVMLFSFSVTVMALSISSIEYLIRENHLVGVDDIFSFGQVISLLVGSIGLATTLFLYFRSVAS